MINVCIISLQHLLVAQIRWTSVVLFAFEKHHAEPMIGRYDELVDQREVFVTEIGFESSCQKGRRDNGLCTVYVLSVGCFKKQRNPGLTVEGKVVV